MRNQYGDEELIIVPGIPFAVYEEAILFAARVGAPCTHCKGPCICGEYLKAQVGIILHYVHNWDRQRFIELHRKATWIEKERPGVGRGYAWLLEDGVRHPTRRHPEHDGFEIDHIDGERWRRFYIPKLMKLRRK